MDIHDLKIFLTINTGDAVFPKHQITVYDTAGEQVRY